MLVAQDYNRAVLRAGVLLIPLISECRVEQVSLGERFATVRVRFESQEDVLHTRAARGVTTLVKIDTLHMGFPVITFLVLILALPGLRLKQRAIGACFGVAVLFAIYSLWMLVAFYQFVAEFDIIYLQENPITRLLPHELYVRYKQSVFLFLGQALPVGIYAALFFRPGRKARTGG
jgi:hypothetical protein